MEGTTEISSIVAMIERKGATARGKEWSIILFSSHLNHCQINNFESEENFLVVCIDLLVVLAGTGSSSEAF